MNFTVPELIAAAVAILVLGFLLHKYLPAGKIAQAEHWAVSEAAKAGPAIGGVEAFIESEALHALASVETWLTDTSSEDAAIAKANAKKATKAAALRTHIAALQAKLPAA